MMTVVSQTPEGWAAEYDASDDLRAEFLTRESYVAFREAEKEGRIRINRDAAPGTPAADAEPDLLNKWHADFFAGSAEMKAGFGRVDAYIDHHLEARYAKSPTLQSEFGSVKAYAAYMKAMAARRRRQRRAA